MLQYYKTFASINLQFCYLSIIFLLQGLLRGPDVSPTKSPASSDFATRFPVSSACLFIFLDESFCVSMNFCYNEASSGFCLSGKEEAGRNLFSGGSSVVSFFFETQYNQRRSHIHTHPYEHMHTHPTHMSTPRDCVEDLIGRVLRLTKSLQTPRCRRKR
jgi:hypothetical protein